MIDAPDDGLPAENVGAWAERKYRVLRAYAEMFSTGMKNAWETRVYFDLFAGSGHALEAERDREKATRFLADEYSRAMSTLAYKATPIDAMIPVRSTDKNLLMYYLAFFSKHEKGYEFWEQVRKYSSDQIELGF